MKEEQHKTGCEDESQSFAERFCELVPFALGILLALVGLGALLWSWLKG